jgi:hypothetical protein
MQVSYTNINVLPSPAGSNRTWINDYSTWSRGASKEVEKSMSVFAPMCLRASMCVRCVRCVEKCLGMTILYKGDEVRRNLALVRDDIEDMMNKMLQF